MKLIARTMSGAFLHGYMLGILTGLFGSAITAAVFMALAHR